MQQLLRSSTAFVLSLCYVVNALPTTSDVHSVPINEVEWDVIVVGAGPAGIVLGDRLSNGTGKRTLLLEQGGPSYYSTGGRERPSWLDNTDLSRVDVPGLYKSIFSNPGNGLLCNSTELNTYSACTIGGNTAINAGLFFQPPASDFDQYFPDQWKSKDMVDAISRVRATQPFTDNPSQNGQYYLQSGYTAAKEWLVNGAGYKDVTFNNDPNDKTGVFGRPEFFYINGTRGGPVDTYLAAALPRDNFRLQHHVQVTRIERQGNTATGVSVRVDGAEETCIKLSKGGQVISSGGAFFSPQLLMLSGIGDPNALANLTKNGILSLPSTQWINNTAVGQGLFDNPNTFIELASDSVSSFTYSYNDPDEADRALYLKERSGPYAFASETSAFWDVITLDNHQYGVQGTIDSAGFSGFNNNNTITLNVYGTSGLTSTGKVILNEKGIAGPDGQFFFRDPNDARAIALFIQKLFAGLSKSNSGLAPLNLPASSTLEEIEKYITSKSDYTLGNVNHWTSSCRLGACVDEQTRVVGMTNLFVVDGSILPPLTTNPTFGIMIAAEKAYEFISKLQ